jgi:hypothetical protein
MRGLSFLLSLMVFNATGQSFIEYSDSLGVQSFASGLYGSGLSLYDWNLDGFDDMVLLQEDSFPAFYLNNTSNGFDRVYFEGVDISGDIKSINWIDFNNDGNPDLSFNINNGGPRLLLNQGDFVFQNITEQSGIISLNTDWGFFHSWCDYDRNGLPDLFVANYNFDLAEAGFNYLYRNNGDLTFTDVTSEAGIHQENEPTFIGMWSDYDNDLMPDLFILNDRSPWRNFLYRNSGDGHFVEKGNFVNMNDFMNSMSGTIGDFNNDGYFDVYITNTPIVGNKLYRNSSSGVFSEVSVPMNVQMFQWSWGAVWIDYDNDGWQDLFAVTQPFIGFGAPGYHFLFKNLQTTFEWEPFAGFQSSAGSTYAAARGDFNNDGSPDLVTHSKQPLGTEIWMNNEPAGNYFKVRLQGVISNRDAIGTRIELASSLGKQYRYTYCGEQFLSQNSQWQHFGLGESNLIDSLIVYWPSGHRDHFYNLDVNQSIVIVEGSSLSNEMSIIHGQTSFCQGDSIILSAGEWDSYLWSNGDTTQQTIIHHTESVNVTVFNGEFYIPSDTLVIQEFSSPVENVELVQPSCFGSEDGSLALQLDSINSLVSFLWNNGATSESIYGLVSGVYTANVYFGPGCSDSLEYTLVDPAKLTLDSIHLAIVNDELICPLSYSAEAFISGGQAPYFIQWSIYNASTSELLETYQGDTLTCIPMFPLVNIKALVYDNEGCSDSLVVQSNAITSSNDLALDISVKPNPSSGIFVIEGIPDGSEVLLYNALGVLQETQYLDMEAQKRSISLENLPNGIYSLVISDAKSVHVRRIIKK